MKKFLSLCLILFFPLLVYGDAIFDEIASAIENKMPQIEMEKLIKKYQGENIRTRAYLISVATNLDGDTMVHLSTDRENASGSGINVILYLRPYLVKKKSFSQFKPGDYIRAWGKFKEIRMRTIVLEQGIIKR